MDQTFKSSRRGVNSQLDLVRIVEARSGEQLELARQLFRQYADSLHIDLCFQGFEQELSELPGRYAPPEGRLLVAFAGQDPAGCVALRKVSDGTCEMKRLYVAPTFRGRGIGRMLAQSIIRAARDAGYRQMWLDTLETMVEAVRLYEVLGFHRIDAYYDNPNGCAIFLGLNL